jgi:hypothetical protein
MSKLFPICVFYPKRGHSHGIQCKKATVDNTGFCSYHLDHLTKCNNRNRNLILHEACFANDAKLLNKCLEYLPLKQEEIDTEFEEIVKTGFKTKVGTILLLSQKYFPNYKLIGPYLYNSFSKRLIHFILYKRFIMKQYIELYTNESKIILRILDPLI